MADQQHLRACSLRQRFSQTASADLSNSAGQLCRVTPTQQEQLNAPALVRGLQSACLRLCVLSASGSSRPDLKPGQALHTAAVRLTQQCSTQMAGGWDEQSAPGCATCSACQMCMLWWDHKHDMCFCMQQTQCNSCRNTATYSEPWNLHDAITAGKPRNSTACPSVLCCAAQTATHPELSHSAGSPVASRDTTWHQLC